jgi:hypothetical protein
MDWNDFFLGFFIFATIVCVVCTAWYGSYKYHELNLENFKSNIENMSESNKCFYICDFQYSGTQYFDNYKICYEKRDRINERNCVKV